MTFEIVRMGWPNTAAIVALAIMPILSLATLPERTIDAVQVEQREAAAFCPAAPNGATVLATLLTGSALN